MNWEAVTAIGTLFTGLVIFVTVIIGGRQLDHLRRATQLEAATAVFAELDSPRLIEALRFVRNDLPAHLRDQQFREEIRMTGFADEREHKELIVLRFFERIGVYTSMGLLDGQIVYGIMSGRIVLAWNALQDVISIHRQEHVMWANFDRLTKDTLRWLDRQWGISGETTQHHLELTGLLGQRGGKQPNSAK